MSRLITESPWKKITKAARDAATPSKVAVAYFGKKGDSLLPLIPKSNLVVDASLASVQCGITHPGALRRLRKNGVRIFTLPLLHAKVFAFDTYSFVGSTNASSRSQKVLTEAVLRSSDPATLKSVRKFVDSLCTDELSDDDLEWLETQYKPPSIKLPSASPQPFARLLMQIMPSDKQGFSGHQVQPSLSAWAGFFGVEMDDADVPTLRLRNVDTGDVIDRKVVRHKVVITVDIPEAVPGNLLEVWRVGLNRYDYRVVHPTDAAFKELNTELTTTPNPVWKSGRLWILTGP